MLDFKAAQRCFQRGVRQRECKLNRRLRWHIAKYWSPLPHLLSPHITFELGAKGCGAVSPTPQAASRTPTMPGRCSKAGETLLTREDRWSQLVMRTGSRTSLISHLVRSRFVRQVGSVCVEGGADSPKTKENVTVTKTRRTLGLHAV